MGEGGPAAELHIVEQKDSAMARQGAGGVHHVAFRTPDDVQYEAWAARLNELGIPNSGEVDRFYFRSLYFREPNGILFEIATDGPGFATDEPMETLGEKLALPPFLEPRRAQIEAGLKPIRHDHSGMKRSCAQARNDRKQRRFFANYASKTASAPVTDRRCPSPFAPARPPAPKCSRQKILPA